MSLSTELEKTQSPLPKDWNLCVHPRGWLYFYNPTLKLLTDQDIRDPQRYSQLLVHASEFKSSEWEEGTELMLQVNRNGAIDFILGINHKHCIASQSLSDITHEAVESLEHDVYECIVLNPHRP
ncbi:hypothetical protein VNI00_005667 [Paramarasmius palmivorus]|uniref:Uncharacterized protein n=1 Tax=Paramarasmius palmivorus TaxID=297713 RepID=A0AAW0DAS6_9AGAR